MLALMNVHYRSRPQLMAVLHWSTKRQSSGKGSSNSYDAEGSKTFLRALQEVSTSNELKLIRLASAKAVDKCQTLFRTHIIETPSFQAFLTSLSTKIEQMQQPKKVIEESSHQDNVKTTENPGKTLDGNQ